ncbi:ABC transporter substrate-binding protein [Brevibacillus centrosporus]|jgi:polar amino acid transport system substrate-binding protein|uniref:Amino acid ABC transporter substrate-binding protein, PAAT family n=1 Tax=Brevibacillus centrosporus TaxID=54910 RepID=A0A1I4C2K6_9BACL|nr:ABC transporter substrate-binding protein [Brevibacillus centrosporus]MEC2128867.1 ABC transporter substrate-binding protein [Brevibacillus centrosporus]MED1951428.1 ABC transporter substrate-binding protein [Brevibacillus centrosporus]MED4907631.1 ABC transporter substrate-binding protein [Brevibacillus centrosporus]RNB67087.1 ABC transporter substrate-binding protein [Brevibacillus centrosporus]SFK75013.1 amino acid ABC transporter substrate-binding protein, PAAT family [Brevibacillus cen
MKKAKWTGILLSTVLMSSLLLAACGSQESGSAPAAGGQADSGKKDFTYAMSGVYKPFSFKENGNLTGFDVEIGQALAEKMGMNAVPITNPFETIIQGLDSKKYDSIIGSLTVTEERQKAVSFTNAYYRSGSQIFVQEGNTTIKSKEDLKGKKIGVVKASNYLDWAKKLTDEDKITTYDSDITALLDLPTGRLDAVITDQVVGLRFIKEGGGKVMDVGEPLSFDEQAIAVRKGDQESVDRINKALDEIIKDGTYEKISQKWFGRNILQKQ